ncbi:DUF2520 domain-containing protein [Mucilaginibacter sp. HMF5004]|uniref:Rossmann-like and DUF2520 domain-containing protein n=1 Tax=Mucilaginibacter rivuli TaxID=2857527 RepID=UPI001C5E2040|nr:Rossmann-like and DUF2520 domain-containing protein [Mucilaginibacter rivuli]MBW4889325.1 DUF2520 domain-containing protein [Mucilaginibacter rivuli]
MRTTLIGSGNVATHFGAALKNAGHHIVQVYSPTQHNADLLAYHLGASAISDLDNIDTETDLFIISVKDDVIEQIAKQLAVHQKLIVHTSGATSLQAISQYNKRSGVIYPLQTFSKQREVDFRKVPLCVEGTDEVTIASLKVLAHMLSLNVYDVDTAQRKILHLAAVFACNFPNNLYAVAQGLLAKHQLDFNLLRPLILETAQKVQHNFPAEVQTGPAVRGDEKTMQAHLALLNDDALKQVYTELSQSIIKLDKVYNADR